MTVSHVFLVYVALIPTFAMIYSRLYEADRTAFLFPEELAARRRDEARAELAAKVACAEILVRYFSPLSQQLKSGAVQLAGVSFAHFSARLKDGRRIEFDSTVIPVKWVYAALEPKISLIKANGEVEWTGWVKDYGGWASAYKEEYVHHIAAKAGEELHSTSTALRALTVERPPRVWRYIDFVYFSAITQTTVGYGDMLPNSTNIRIIVIVQLLVSSTLLVVVLSHVADASSQKSPE
jgi:hypothetical protein